MSPQEIRRWVKLGMLAIGLLLTVWSLRGFSLGGGSSGGAGVLDNGIANVCQEIHMAATLNGQTSSGAVSVSGTSGTATLRCPAK